MPTGHRVAREEGTSLVGDGDSYDAVRLRKAFSTPTVGILSFRLSGEILDANQSLQRMCGYTAAELRAIDWKQLTPTEFMPATQRVAHDLATTGEATPYEKQWIRPDGTRWWGLFAPTRVRGEGPDTECLEVIIDITKRKHAEACARAERQKLHDMFQQAPVPVCIVEGPDYTFTFANPSYLALHDKRDLIGMRLADALPAIAAEFIPILDEVVATGVPFVGSEFPIQLVHRAPGDLIYMNFVYTPMRDADGTARGILACGSDVTSQVLARHALEAERELRERFVATLSHDLRTPLGSARMGADLIVRQASDPEIARRASRIAVNIERADQMLQDLLDANRIRAGERIPLELTSCDLAATADETLRELAAMHGDRFELRSHGPTTGNFSCTGIRRIFENLCANAAKYGDPGGPIRLTLRAIADSVTIEVHNQGTPIPPEELPTLFDPFRRTPSAEVTRAKGWGLGLTLVRGVAEAHGGHVSVTSSAASGTTFTVTLPRRVSGPA